MKNNSKKMTAIEFMRSYDETQKVMESIANQTAGEHKALVESMNDMNDTFDMNSLLDVDISSNDDDMQPSIYTQPIEELSETDKALIINDFTKMIADMHEDVIDFSDIGPIATVIQDRYGFKQNIEDFLRNTIDSAVNWQQSQQFAHENESAGEEIAEEAPVSANMGEENRAPTDIEPAQQSGVDGGQGVGLSPEAVPAVEPVAAPDIAPEVAPEVAPVIAPEVDEVAPVIDPVASPEVAPEVPELDEVAPEATPEVPELDEVAPEVSPEATPEVEDVTPEGDEGDEGEEKEEGEEGDEGEEKEEGEEDEIENIDAQLESIRSAFLSKKTGIDSLVESAIAELSAESKIDAQLEAIKTKILGQAVVENAVEETTQPQIEAVEPEPNVIAQLESIAKAYHSTENAKVESAKKEQKLIAQLESIAANYHNTEKAKLEAIQKAAEVDSKLNSLVESYHSSQKANIEQRKQIKEKLKNI